MMALFFVLLLVVSVQVAICKPYDLAVTDVGTNTAIIHWKTTELSTTIENFRILCNGTRHYVSMDGEHLLDTDNKLQYAPSGTKNAHIGALKENFNYSCTVQEGISSQVPILYGELSDPCNFSTDYGDPEQPKTPEVQILRRRRSIRIKLFPTSTRFGPISGYQVQFHLVESKTLDGLALIDDDAYDPRLPSSLLVSKNEAQLSTEAKSFWLDFENGKLPVNIVIGQKLLQGALKDDVEYTVATVPYTVFMKENESVLLFTPSNVSTIFKTWNASLTPALLDTNDPAELALVVALGIGLPLLLLGYLACFAVALYCFLRRRRKKRMRKEYSRRDVIQALALRRAQQMGIELPWYNHRTTDENQGDLPWLDPFSPANAQPRIVSSSSSQVDLNQLEAGYGSRAQPPDPMMPNDVVLTDTPPVYSAGTDVSSRQGDIDSTAAAQKSDAAQLVAAVLTRAVLVISRLTTPVAGQGISGISATQLYDHDGSFVTSDNAELAESDTREDCEEPTPHQFVEEAAEKMKKSGNHDLATHATLSAGGSHISIRSSQTSSSSGSNYHFSCSQDSTHSLIGSEHLSLHQVGSTELCVHNSSSKCDGCNFGDSESLSGKIYNIEMQESFYSSKSSNIEEQSASDTRGDGTVQSVDCEQLKMDTSKASQIDDQSSSDVFNPRSLRFIASEHLSLRQIALAAQCVLTAVSISSNCDSYDLSENKSLPEQASLEVEESFHSFISEEKGSSDTYQLEEVNAAQTANCEQLRAQLVASADQCTKSNECDDQSTDELQAEAEKQKPGDAVLEEHPSASVDIDVRSGTDHDLVELALPLKEASPEVNSLRMGRIDSNNSLDFSQNITHSLISSEHQSFHQVTSTDSEQCVFSSSKCDDGDLVEEGASLEVEESFYCSKSSNNEEMTSSGIPQLEDNAVQSSADCDNHSIIDLGAEKDCNLGESKPPPEEASLEVEESFYSLKSKDVEEQTASVIQVDITAQSTDFEQLSVALASADPCSHCDGHSTDNSGREKQQPGGAVLELQCSTSIDNDYGNNDSKLVECAPPLELEDTTLDLEVNSSRASKIIDDDSSSDYFQGSIQSMDKHFSLHQVASSADCMHSVSLLSNYHDSSNKPQTENISSEEDESCYSSKQTSEEKLKSSQSTRQENLSPQPEASATSLDESDGFGGCTRVTTCDVEEIVAASLEFRQMVYDSRSSTCCLRHIYTEYNLAGHNPLLEECSLEVNVSSLSSKTSRSDSSSYSKLSDNSLSYRASTPSISSEPSTNNATVNHMCSSSDFCVYIAQSSACERLSLRQGELTAPSVHNSFRTSSRDDCGVNSTCEGIQRSAAALKLTINQSWESNTDDHTNYDRDIVDKPLPIGTISQASTHGTKVNLGDDGTSDSFLHQDGLQTVAGDDQHPSPHQLASADQSIESSPQPIAGSYLDGHITNDIHVGTEEPLAGDAGRELHSSDFHQDNINFQSPHQLASAADPLMQSNSLKSFKLINSAGCSSEHVSIDMEDTNYFTASSSQCSSEPAAGSEDGHTTSSHPMMTPNQHSHCAPEVGIIMEPLVHSSSRHYLTIDSEQQGNDPYSYNIGDYGISASYSSSDCSYPLEPDDEYPSLQQVEATVQRLPRFSDHQLSPVGSVVSAENETRILMELNEEELPHSRHGDQELPAICAMSYNTVVADSSTDYYSTMGSHHNSGHHMSPELPYSRHYGDQELPDASVDATSHHTVVPDPSTDYYSAVSATSSHDSGHHMRSELPCSRYGDQELPDASVDATSHHTVVPDPSTDFYSAVSETSSHDSNHAPEPCWFSTLQRR